MGCVRARGRGRENIFEQINTSQGKVVYLHHDPAGSTRLLTGSTGTVEGKCSFSAYGTPTCEGSGTPPLGYDAQYTSTDTGLIYLRNRVYDPSTAQFLSRDPLASITGEPYAYAEDDPLNVLDPNGLAGCGSIPIVSSLCEFGQESGVSEVAAGALNFLTFGTSNEIAGEVFSFNSSCANFGETGTLLGMTIGFFDGEDEAEVLAESADEANSVTSTARSTYGADGAESVIIKERAPDGETVLVVHQVGQPLPGGGTIIIHQHAKLGPLPGSELFFPDVNP